MEGTDLIARAILGEDCRMVVVASKRYVIDPPTIAKICGMGMYLDRLDVKEGMSMEEILRTMKDIKNVSRALSWAIRGDESLTDELAEGTLEENIHALNEALSLVKTENFLRLSLLRKSVGKLIANSRR